VAISHPLPPTPRQGDGGAQLQPEIRRAASSRLRPRCQTRVHVLNPDQSLGSAGSVRPEMARLEAGDNQAQRQQGGQCPQKQQHPEGMTVVPDRGRTPWCRFLVAIMPLCIGNVSGRETGAWNI
jgi:hypothetical protein